MTRSEVIKIKSLLEGNYPNLAKQDDLVYLSILKDYDYSIMAEATKNIIMREKFPPNIAVILEEYDKVASSKTLKIIKAMNDAGLFYHPTELDKAIKWAKRNSFPDWFKQMMIDFLNQNQKLGMDKQFLIGASS